MKEEVGLRLIVEHPVEGVTYAVQRGRDELLEPVLTQAERIVFELSLTVADLDARPPRLTGPFAQGPPRQRFVYVNSGAMAGQEDSCWKRRAKVPLVDIDRELLVRVLRKDGVGSGLEAAIHGVAKDGGPACASVPLSRRWRLAAAPR